MWGEGQKRERIAQSKSVFSCLFARHCWLVIAAWTPFLGGGGRGCSRRSAYHWRCFFRFALFIDDELAPSSFIFLNLFISRLSRHVFRQPNHQQLFMSDSVCSLSVASLLLHSNFICLFFEYYILYMGGMVVTTTAAAAAAVFRLLFPNGF